MDLDGGNWPISHLLWFDHPEKELLFASWSGVPKQQCQPKAQVGSWGEDGGWDSFARHGPKPLGAVKRRERGYM